MPRRARKSTFGSVDQLPSGRHRARFTGPDGRTYSARTPDNRPLTFDSRGDADAYLAAQRTAISRGTWQPPGYQAPRAAVLAFGAYADRWLEERQLADRTRGEYRSLLDNRLLPTFRDRDLTAITAAEIRAWHLAQPKATPTRTAAAYALLRTILGTAVRDELLTANPARIVGAGATKRTKQIRPATLPELEVITKAMPQGYDLLPLLLAWTALRFGEVAELRRGDVEVRTEGTGDTAVKVAALRISRAVVKLRGSKAVKAPKSAAGRRLIYVPPHLVPMLEDRLRGLADDDLVFPSPNNPTTHLAHSTFHRWFATARAAAKRPDLRAHDLRHTGAVLAAQSGATLAELMARLGHSTVGAAMRYQHAASDRDRAIAEALSRMATGQSRHS